MLFRAFVGFKPEKRPRSHSGSSDDSEKVAFVGQWGGSVMRNDNLPEAMQVALMEVARLEADKAQGGTDARR